MIRANMQRLLAPRSIALLGSTWADAVAAASRTVGYSGKIWRIHPKRVSQPGAPYFRSIDELPEVPDAAFIAAPNTEVPAIAAALRRRGAGGFVCFASGFAETGTAEGERLTAALLEGAGELPFFGPNCYGFINFFDRVALWPDQLVGTAPERGVAILCQSGTLALNLLFSRRSLPLGYVITVGNQTRVAIEDLIEMLSEEARVSAFGIYVEGVRDAERFAGAVARARAAGKPVALVKAGRTEAAIRTAHSHTGALAGADQAFDTFCDQAGVARCESLATLCETLKIFHSGGPLPGRRVLIMGASGGDMAMTSDASRHLGLDFAPFPDVTRTALRQILTDKVTLANPFDFHTHIWFDRPALHAMFSQVHSAGYDAVGFMLDCPPEPEADATSYIAAIDEFLAAVTASAGVAATGAAGALAGGPTRAALICALPESMSAATREKCLRAGVAPLQGQREALEALDLAGRVGAAWAAASQVQLRLPTRLPTRGATSAVNATSEAPAAVLTEYEAKLALAAFGVPVPKSQVVSADSAAELGAAAATAAEVIGFPVVIKALGAHLEHKSDVGGVVLNVRSRGEAQAAAQRLRPLATALLVEAMITDAVAEILVGVTVDPQFGQLLLLGAGGVLTELLQDSVTLLPPFNAAAIERALDRLKIARLLRGYRNRSAGDVAALIDTVLACARYADANRQRLVEMDLNPVIVRPQGLGAVAVDALIRLNQ